MKQKKKLTVKQQQKKASNIYRACFVGQYVSVLTPFIIMGAVNWNQWFGGNDGWRVGIGGTIALALMTIATTLITKKKEDKTITNGYIALCLGWYSVAFVVMLIQSVIHDIGMIMLIGGTGMLAAAGLNVLGNSYKKKADTIKEVMGDTEKDVMKEKYKKELEEEKDIDPVE